MCHVSVCKPLWWEHVCPSRWTVMLLAQSFANGNLRCCPQGQCEMNVLEKMLCVMFLFANHCGGSMSVQVVGR